MGQNCCAGDAGVKQDEKLDDYIKNDEKESLVSKKESKNIEKIKEKETETVTEKKPDSQNIKTNIKDDPKDGDYKPPDIEQEILMEKFEKAIIAKDFATAMDLIEKYEVNDFMSHSFPNGEKALHYAIRASDSRFAYFVLQKGADPNVQTDETGNTALHIAVELSDLGMVTLLLNNEASKLIRNKNDERVTDIAKKINNQGIMELLGIEFKKVVQENTETDADTMLAAGLNTADDIDNMSDHENDIEYTHTKKDDVSDPETEVNPDESERSHSMTVQEAELLIESSFRGNSGKKALDDAKKDDDNKNKGSANGIGMLKRKKSQLAVDTVKKIDKQQEKLPALGSWLEKKRNAAPHYYQKRFLCIVDGHLLWSDKRPKVNPNTKLDETERKKFNGSISLLMVKDAKVKDSKKGEFKFEIIVEEKKKTRAVIWKARDQVTRDKWVNGIKVHIKHVKSAIDSYSNLSKTN